MTKRYDRAYFDRWYRGDERPVTPAALARKVALAIATAEYFLQRQLRNVLDVGCGEGAWQPHVARLRPRVAYTGVDPSEYACRRFGEARNIRRGSFGALTAVALDSHYDLVVCSDVLHYVADREIVAGMRELAPLCRGTAWLEVLTAEDSIVGDLEGLIRRPAAWYARTFNDAGMLRVAPYTWLSPRLADDASALEACPPRAATRERKRR